MFLRKLILRKMTIFFGLMVKPKNKLENIFRLLIMNIKYSSANNLCMNNQGTEYRAQGFGFSLDGHQPRRRGLGDEL